MYVLAVNGIGILSLSDIGRMVERRFDASPVEAMRHLSAIERIGVRGIAYSNEDFDVLSAAFDFANRNA